MIDTVIFDFDGTLADTSELIINSFQTVYRKFHGEEKPVDYIKNSFGEPLKVTFAREFTQPFEEVFNVYHDYQAEKFQSEVKLFDKAVETLVYLKDKNIKTAVVTARMRQSVIKALEDFGIIQYFDVVIAVDDTINHKPHPEPLLKAINMLKSKPQETLFVGDSRFDMECAVNAGAIPVLVGWHIGNDQLQRKYNIEYFIGNLFEITKII